MTKKKAKKRSIAIVSLMAILSMIILHNAFSWIRGFYSEQLYSNALELKTGFIKSIVQTLGSDVSSEKEAQNEEFTVRLENSKDYVSDIISHTDKKPEVAVKDYLKSREDGSDWTYLAYDKETNEIIMDSDGLLGDSFNGDIEEIESCFSAFEKLTFGNTIIIYGITNDYLKNYVLEDISRKVMDDDYEDDTLLWINEIRNFEGGYNYAVHIADSDGRIKKGRLLSTDTTDAAGNTYLAAELDMLKESGEALYTYQMKKEGTEDTYPILVYAKLVKDYNLVVGMQSDMRDVTLSVEETRKTVNKYLYLLEAGLIFTFLVLIVLVGYSTARTERVLTTNETKLLVRKVQNDALTGATSRQFGEEKLREFFQAFKEGKPSPVIMILDVDYFKQINDTYGHDVGDAVLRRVVTGLYRTIRQSDYLIRWGGDEFIGVYLGVTHENIEIVAEKVMESVRLVRVVTEDGTEIKVTASVGFAEFGDSDEEYGDGLKRADNMLYKSKLGGRNQYNIAKVNAAIDKDKKSDSISRN